MKLHVLKLALVTALLAITSDGLAQDHDYRLCTWCYSDADFKSYAESIAAANPSGFYFFYIGNPDTNEVKRIRVSVEHQPAPAEPLVMSFFLSADSEIVDDFASVANIAMNEHLIVIPPGACSSCGSFIGANGEPDFYGYLYQHATADIISELVGLTPWWVYLFKAQLGYHVTLVIVFPNGDSAKFKVLNVTNTPGSIQFIDGTAVDEDGNPITEPGGSQYDSRHGNYFIIRVFTGGGTTWYTCTRSNIPGTGTECVPDP